jgi:RNA polymerase sigma-70 factor (ECF subfamily)
MGQRQIMTYESRNTPFVQASDATLIGAAKQGNSAAFDILAKRYEAKIFRIILRITRNQEDAQDAMQQGLHKAFTRLETFEGESTFRTWLTRIAINEVLMLMRKNRRMTSASLDDARFKRDNTLAQEIPDSAANPEEKYALQEREKILTLAMKQLPSEMQTALRLHLEDHTLGEIAEILGLGVSAVKARLFRARGRLHGLLKVHFARNWASFHSGAPPVA